ncbi:MAG: aminopeptidase [Deltaproteobacteria bacterium]|jgi:predicted aminopeptidase|nr:aminopeptidase [Deltaproteobacteria bacterium]
MKFSWVHISLGLVCLVILAACGDLDYYVHCASGHLSLMSKARPIDEVMADPHVNADERRQLEKVLEIRNFASSALSLPDNKSYRNYADIQRPYVVWNVVAAPEFSLEAKQWCFPFAGCVSYRGYFDQSGANRLALHLTEEGFDVDVYGVQAYSTLKWFDDPVLNTFLNGDELSIAALIFHELAHQVVYVPGDTAFNEAFAKTVELEGLKRWVLKNSDIEQWQKCLVKEDRREVFQGFLAETRDTLKAIYREPFSIAEKRSRKQAVLEQAHQRFQDLLAQSPEYSAYESWMSRGLNNARLASVATYYELVPAFRALLAKHEGHFQPFFAEVSDLGKLPKDVRLARLKSLTNAQFALLTSP